MVSSKPTAGTDPAEGRVLVDGTLPLTDDRTPPAGVALPPTATGSVTVTRVPVVPEPLASDVPPTEIGAVTLISVVLPVEALPLEDEDPLDADPPPAATGAVTLIKVPVLPPLVEAAPPPSDTGAVTLITVLEPVLEPVVTPLRGVEP